jgi:hypothetical protein
MGHTLAEYGPDPVVDLGAGQPLSTRRGLERVFGPEPGNGRAVTVEEVRHVPQQSDGRQADIEVRALEPKRPNRLCGQQRCANWLLSASVRSVWMLVCIPVHRRRQKGVRTGRKSVTINWTLSKASRTFRAAAAVAAGSSTRNIQCLLTGKMQTLIHQPMDRSLQRNINHVLSILEAGSPRPSMVSLEPRQPTPPPPPHACLWRVYRRCSWSGSRPGCPRPRPRRRRQPRASHGRGHRATMATTA